MSLKLIARHWLTIVVVAVALLCTAGAMLGNRRPASAPGGSTDPEPVVLRMPFERGTVVWLMQGTLAPAGHTHRRASYNNAHALDFATPIHDTVQVVSAADGTVSFVFDRSEPEDVDAGLGYGNQVKIVHADGTYTFYAHLDSVLVKRGDPVASGARIGTMGRTGRAGIRHLHLGLHRDAPTELGGASSLPIDALVTMDLAAADMAFRELRGDALELDYQQQFKGHLYASENSPHSPALRGAAPPLLRQQLAAEAVQVQQALDLQLRLAALAGREDEEVDWYRAELEAIAAVDPGHPAMIYLRAVAVEIPSSKWKDARASLLAAERANCSPRRHVPWLSGRVQFQLGLLARREGNLQQARDHLERAVKLSTGRKQLEDARRELQLTAEP